MEQPSMIHLSVVIITLNEEKRIHRCIDSVKAAADEILIVDSFSTDRTKQIAESMGAKVITHKFEGHIQQKNYSIAQATFDNILSLDADEALDNVALEKVQEIKKQWHHDAYSFNRMTNYCGQWIRHCGWYPDKKIRLFDRRKAQWGGQNPHDSIALAHNASCKHVKGNILHYSFPTIASHAETANRFSDIASKVALKRGKKARFLYHVLLNPTFTFIKKYFFQLGILDGYYGFAICALSAHANFLKYLKIWQHHHDNSHLPNR